MSVFRRLTWVALCAGLLSGIFVTAANQIGTVPLILKAEVYEKQAPAQSHEQVVAWEPENGVERTAYTFVADLLTGIDFALLLAAGLAVRGSEISWRTGLFWGLARFATFTIAPGLGLPPELPGTEAAPLLQRQLWWLATAASTGCGLAPCVHAATAMGNSCSHPDRAATPLRRASAERVCGYRARGTKPRVCRRGHSR
jgi:cobalt transporter subunit CbtA